MEDEFDVNETEFSLNEEEIEEWIAKLVSLKNNKRQIELDIDDENVLKVNFEDASGEVEENDTEY